MTPHSRGLAFGRTPIGRALLPVVRVPLTLALGAGYALALTGFATVARGMLWYGRRRV